MRKYLTLKLKKPLSDLYRGQLVEPKSLNKNEQPPLAKPTRHKHAYALSEFLPQTQKRDNRLEFVKKLP